MQDLVPLGAYELLTNHPPPPLEAFAERLSSPHALRTYQAVAIHFLSWIERDPFEADHNVVSNYKAEMLINHRPSLVALRLRIIAELYEEAIARGLTSKNPVAGVPPPAFTPDEACPPPSPDEARAHLPLCRHNREACKRDRALCLLIIDTDIAPEDAKSLRVKDLAYEGDHCFLEIGSSTHNGRQRLEIPDPIAKSLDEYLAGREVADDSPLFVLSAFGAIAA